jgi:hypothetical protein
VISRTGSETIGPRDEEVPFVAGPLTVQSCRLDGSDHDNMAMSQQRGVSVIQADTRVARNTRVAAHELGRAQGGVLLRLDTGAYHGVNEVGFIVWQLLDMDRTFSELLALLESRLEERPPTLEADITAFLRDLSDRGLVNLHAAV